MRIGFLLTLGLILILLLSIIVKGGEPIAEIKLQSVDKDTPKFARAKKDQNGVKYELKMVKIENNPQIKKPPLTEAKILYFAKVKLGKPEIEYGVLVDFEGSKKVLWVDSNANLDYAEETPYEIFKSDLYPGLNIYYSPTPIAFKLKYQYQDHDYQTKVIFDLPYLLIERIGNTDLFRLKSRTWFSGVFNDDGDEINIAIVDTNDNGIYNDPDDRIYIDRDYDLKYSLKEGTPIKMMKDLKLKSKKQLRFNYQYCPEKLVLE